MTTAADQQVWTTRNIHLQKRLSSHHIFLLSQVILTQVQQMKNMLHQLRCCWQKKKIGQFPNGKKFRYSEKHRSILMKYFEGETFGFQGQVVDDKPLSTLIFMVNVAAVQ